MGLVVSILKTNSLNRFPSTASQHVVRASRLQFMHHFSCAGENQSVVIICHTYKYISPNQREIKSNCNFYHFQEISPDATLIGIGGVCVAEFPYHQWKQKAWFRAAVVIASLSSKYMSHLIPGYRNLEQSFDTDYIGKLENWK